MDYIVTVSDRNEQKMIYFNPVVFSLFIWKNRSNAQQQE